MRVLLTRPAEDSERFACLLRARGHQAIVSPLIDIRFLDGAEVPLDGVQAILATSANGIHALARRTPRRNAPVLAVGPQTAAAAEAEGFRVRNAHGNAAALADAVQEWAAPAGGALLYAAARERRWELERALSGRGYAVRIEVLYEATERPGLSAEADAALRSGSLDAAMLFSPRSAAVFARQVQSAKLEEHCIGVLALCIGGATAEALAPLAFSEVRIAAHPDRDGMLALLD